MPYFCDRESGRSSLSRAGYEENQKKKDSDCFPLCFAEFLLQQITLLF